MTERHPRTMKIPLDPPFTKGDNYPSLWQREVWRDLKKLFSKQFQYTILNEQKRLFGISVIVIYLLFGLPARSRFGEGRCLGFGAFHLSL